MRLRNPPKTLMETRMKPLQLPVWMPQLSWKGTPRILKEVMSSSVSAFIHVANIDCMTTVCQALC